eukprot:CAMPEP_0113458850 /NCGR_PEP_ID=MMETSP0014_2-20120614/10136_1 /TAXON_ID=2857 /ORGANISM="Nitzschia sp." /LENGTH=457 /DNA_ID=CAMNT_0000350389 /DNA_START=290 /DNA_END=1660 /DNA_ORIENTATION=- /assembly_acc=CAM_ASM_000159
MNSNISSKTTPVPAVEDGHDGRKDSSPPPPPPPATTETATVVAHATKNNNNNNNNNNSSSSMANSSAEDTWEEEPSSSPAPAVMTTTTMTVEEEAAAAEEEEEESDDVENNTKNVTGGDDVEEGLGGGGEGSPGGLMMKSEDKDGIVAQQQQQNNNNNTSSTKKKKQKQQREMNPKFKDVNETGSWGELSRKEVYIAVGVLVAVLVAVVVAVVAVVVTNNNNNNDTEIVDAPTRSPTQAPTPMPVEEELMIVLDGIGSNPVTASLLDDLPNDPSFYEGLLSSGGSTTPATPQQMAMSWLLYEDTIKDPSQSTQRWTFASFYFQTGGGDGTWTSASASTSATEGWLSPTTPVCQWEHISCELNGNLQELDFDSVNLVADQIPVELSLLTDVQSILLQNNQLQGEIDPDVFSVNQLPRLGLLYLNNNFLTGPIPEGLTQEESGGLHTLYVQNNNLTGTW